MSVFLTLASLSVPEACINNDTGKCEPCMSEFAATCADDGGDMTW